MKLKYMRGDTLFCVLDKNTLNKHWTFVNMKIQSLITLNSDLLQDGL